MTYQAPQEVLLHQKLSGPLWTFGSTIFQWTRGLSPPRKPSYVASLAYRVSCLSGRAPPTCICCLQFATTTASAVVATGISLPTFRTWNDNARGENMCLLLLQHYSVETQLFHNCVFNLVYNSSERGSTRSVLRQVLGVMCLKCQ